MISGLSHITFITSDLEKMSLIITQVLGGTEICDCGGKTLSILLPKQNCQDALPASPSAGSTRRSSRSKNATPKSGSAGQARRWRYCRERARGLRARGNRSISMITTTTFLNFTPERSKSVWCDMENRNNGHEI